MSTRLPLEFQIRNFSHLLVLTGAPASSRGSCQQGKEVVVFVKNRLLWWGYKEFGNFDSYGSTNLRNSLPKFDLNWFMLVLFTHLPDSLFQIGITRWVKNVFRWRMLRFFLLLIIFFPFDLVLLAVSILMLSLFSRIGSSLILQREIISYLIRLKIRDVRFNFLRRVLYGWSLRYPIFVALFCMFSIFVMSFSK